MTFSIVARCAATGQMGSAATTAVPAVGKLVTHAWPGAGAIATQAQVNPYLGIDGVSLLRDGLSAVEVLERLKRSDPRIERRQVGVVDREGRVAAWTGSGCLTWCGHEEGAGFAVQGNRLAGPQVLRAVAAAFEQTRELPLSERFLEALAAGVAAGGDTDGEVSATIYIMGREEYPLCDIRVDEHPRPIDELRRLHAIFAEQILPEIGAMPTRDDPAGKEEERDI